MNKNSIYTEYSHFQLHLLLIKNNNDRSLFSEKVYSLKREHKIIVLHKNSLVRSMKHVK